MSNRVTYYNSEDVIKVIVDYFLEYKDIQDLSEPFYNVYQKIITYANNTHSYVLMPKFSQMRKIIIDKFKDYDMYQDGVKITTMAASCLVSLYEDYDDDELQLFEMYDNYDKIEYIIENDISKVTVYSQPPIIYTIKLPSTEILNKLAKGFSEENSESLIWGRVKLIEWICQKIKKKNPKLILAVIPPFSRMNYLNDMGVIKPSVYDYDTIMCDSLCMFVKNTPEGRRLVEEWRNSQFPTDFNL